MLFSGDDTPPPLKSSGPPTLQEGGAPPPPKPVTSARYSAIAAATPRAASAPPAVPQVAAASATSAAPVPKLGAAPITSAPAQATIPKVAAPAQPATNVASAPVLSDTPRTPVRPQSFVPWPRSTPPAARALQLLMRVTQEEETEPITAALLTSRLTAGELAALLVDSPLRDAVLMRWRLAWALDRRPAPGVAFEEAAVEALLAEVDTVMGNLPVSEDDALQKEALASVRGALARDAVALSELSHRLLDQAKQLRAPRTSGPRPAAQRMTVESGDAVPVNRQRWLIVATVVLAVLGGTYQAIKSHDDDVEAQRHAPKDVPAGTSGTIDSRSGMAILHRVDGRFDETALRHFKAQVEARGMKVIQVSNGDYLAVPSDKPLPHTP